MEKYYKLAKLFNKKVTFDNSNINNHTYRVDKNKELKKFEKVAIIKRVTDQISKGLEKQKEFEVLYNQSKETDFLKEFTKFSHRDEENLSFYKKLMQSLYYNEAEIAEMLDKDPITFFKHAWYFPNKQWTSLSLLYVCHEGGTSYTHNNFLPNSFWENAELVKKFLDGGEKYLQYKQLETGNDKDKLEDFEFFSRGFRIGIMSKQLEVIKELQDNFSKFALLNEEGLNQVENKKTKSENYNLVKEEFNKKLSGLTALPLFSKDLKTSQKIYNKVINFEKKDIRGLIKHEHNGYLYD